MNYLSLLSGSRIGNLIISIFLCGMWVTFAWAHVEAYRTTGEIAFIAFCISESLQAFFFLIRRTPKHVATDPFAWLVAVSGTFSSFLLRPSTFALFDFGDGILLIGVLLQILGLLSLNRSFAIVPAQRKIMKSGMYAFVRHPMYTSYIFLFLGYVLFNTNMMNVAIVIASFIFMFLRISEEEKLLLRDVEYREYKKAVKWRLLPFIY